MRSALHSSSCSLSWRHSIRSLNECQLFLLPAESTAQTSTSAWSSPRFASCHWSLIPSGLSPIICSLWYLKASFSQTLNRWLFFLPTFRDLSSSNASRLKWILFALSGSACSKWGPLLDFLAKWSLILTLPRHHNESSHCIQIRMLIIECQMPVIGLISIVWWNFILCLNIVQAIRPWAW